MYIDKEAKKMYNILIKFIVRSSVLMACEKTVKKSVMCSNVYNGSGFAPAEIILPENVSADMWEDELSSPDVYVFPGFADVHVHFREPGFSYKEDIASGCAAAAAGGYTDVCTMPNLSPVPDSREHLDASLGCIRRSATIGVYPYGSITVGEKGGELADLEGMAPDVAGFTDDGVGVASEDMMREAMLKAKAVGRILAAHCEDMSLVRGGYIHDGVYAAAHGHKGICSESEWKPIERDIRLARETGCAYHVCHISTKESVELIRRAKADGVNITCETGPHYLVLCDEDLMEDGRFKMNPPLRSREDRDALVAGIVDGTIDMIATVHAPHSAEEKAQGLKDSMMGVVGLETAFSVLYTHLVKNGIISLEKLVELMAVAPRERFGIKSDMTDSYTVFKLGEEKYTVDPESFKSRGRATPFAGWELLGECLMTVYNGRAVYEKK